MGATPARELRERDAELETIDELVRAAAGGGSGLIVIEGRAGSGKTALFAAVGGRASAAGMRVLSARGSELERDFPFGVVGQLLNPVVFGAADNELARWFAGAAELARPLFSSPGPGPSADEEELPFRRRHGLFWLVANLAREAPLLVAIDNAQWVDEPSAGFLRHLATRLEMFPVLLVLAARPHDGTLSELSAEPRARVLRPAALSRHAVGEWLSDSLDQPAEDGFVAACHATTQGNPFMVAELVRELRSEGLEPRDDAIDRLRGVSPRAVRAAVLRRLSGLSADAGEVARTVALLGPSDVAVLATVTGLERPSTLYAAAELTRAGVLDSAEPPDFVQPLVRTVLYEEIPAPERRLEHGRAARALHDAGRSSEQIAAQLMLAAPIGEAWAAEALSSAAAEATARGAPKIAARFLTRLLEEIDRERRFDVLLALGRAEALAGLPDGLGHLRQAMELAEASAQRAQAAISLGRMLRYDGAGADAVAVIEEAASQLDDQEPELAALAEQELLATSTVSYSARARLRTRRDQWRRQAARPPRTLLDRLLSAADAVDTISSGQPVPTAAALAGLALASDPGAGHLGRHLRLLTAYAFLLCDRYDRVEPILAELDEIAATRGGAEMAATVASQRALVAQRQGRLPAAESAALEALEAVAELDAPPSFLLTAAAALIWVAVERGDPPHPLAARARDDGDSLFALNLNYARAVRHVAERRLEQGVDELLAVGERELTIGWSGPSQFAWRSQAALALAQLGDETRARGLAAEELELARACGAPRALGVALRANGLLIEDGRLERLHESVSVLEPSGAELEHARALVDLGAALRRSRQPRQARSPLRAGHALATSCGATLLATRAHEELLAAGARPRRTALRGRDALTPSELRVAELAAQSLRNRDIAQALFVTEKTVERHLGHAYTKLGVTSRKELPAALADGT
jgi:DNA-binding CsgD family transcriptional regulator